MAKITLDDICAEAEAAAETSTKLPPVELWDPPLSGDIDIRITRNGDWYHEGGLIKRQPLVKLFSSILKREGDDYFLVTPVEKWRIQVEDVPFTVIALERSEDANGQVLRFTTNVEDSVVAGPDNPVRVEADRNSGEPSPYLLIRRNLEGRISRPVYYELVELAEPGPVDAAYGVSSQGGFFELK